MISQEKKTNKKRTQSLLKCQQSMTIQQETYYHPNYYKSIGIDIPRQTNASIPHQINFKEKLQEDDGAAIFFIAEKQQKNILNFPSDSLIVTEWYKQWNTKKY